MGIIAMVVAALETWIIMLAKPRSLRLTRQAYLKNHDPIQSSGRYIPSPVSTEVYIRFIFPFAYEISPIFAARRKTSFLLCSSSF
jgi:hypothetical protein